MGTQLARQRQINPKDVHDDIHDLARVNPAELANQVTKIVRKKNQADGELDRADAATSLLFGGLGALATAGVLAIGTGAQTAQRDALIREWELRGNELDEVSPTPWERGVKDPTIAFWKVPWLALPAIVSAGAYFWANSARHSSAKGKRSIAGAWEAYFGFTTIASTALLVHKVVADRSYSKRAHQIMSGVKRVELKVANG